MAETYVSPTYGCGGCTIRWKGVSRCHCAACHRTFNGIELFDRHRVDVNGKGTCLDPTTITAQPKAVKGQPRPAKTTTGERVMWETDGIWRSVETPAQRAIPNRGVA